MPSITARETRPIQASIRDVHDDRPDFGERWNQAALEDERLLRQEIERERHEIERKLHEMEPASQDLDIERLQSSLLFKRRRLFTLRAKRAPITRVSDDVLALIFEYSADDLRPYFSEMGRKSLPCQVGYSHVCRRWRRVAWQTPYLWSRFDIDSERTLRYAEEMLSEHDPVSFGVTIQRPCSSPLSEDPLLRSICTFVSAQSYRLWHLQVDMCDHGIEDLFTGAAYDFPVLRSLLITTDCVGCCFEDQRPWRGDGIAHAPLLDRMEFYTLNLPRDFQSFPTVTRLSLASEYGCSADDFAGFLRAFPGLQALHAQNVYDFMEHLPDGLITAKPVHLPNLKTLSATGVRMELLDALAAVIDLCHLEHLDLKGQHSLDLGPWIADGGPVQFLRVLDSVTTLIIYPTDLGNQIVECLEESSSDTWPLLPRLHTLSVRMRSYPERRAAVELWEELVCLLPTMISARRKSTCPIVRLRIPSLLTHDQRKPLEGLVLLENSDLHS
ncbi:hypothetical protein CALVIDRAFT_542749 [Calocera viscosa TUFC12733]|uniref:Uncharacterized protein n=1 Tax=Calocera viscosa (strain TUFC12733) TaxID=1330018 RepID=A0A167GA74_CALVF|nr:hypothetical protein CALVIDRAFT_542749 [Calocera viscosa TUFC12733]